HSSRALYRCATRARSMKPLRCTICCWHASTKRYASVWLRSRSWAETRCGCCRRIRRVLLFFFQAEDGIRDFHVTGVQTCALPISPVIQHADTLYADIRIEPNGRFPIPPVAEERAIYTLQGNVGIGGEVFPPDRLKSEERRVGKEWRARRASYVKVRLRRQFGDQPR